MKDDKAVKGSGKQILGLKVSSPERSDPSHIRSRMIRLFWILLILSVVFPFVGLLPEVIHIIPDLNDSAFHMGLTRNTLEALEEGCNPLDFWFPSWLGGFPIFHYYQPGPYSQGRASNR